MQLGGIVGRDAPTRPPGRPLNGGPQMVEVSRDGRRVYLTNSLYASWDAQFYPEGIRAGWPSSTSTRAAGIDPGPGLLPDGDFDGPAAAPGSPQGGDASSDSYCFP